MCKRKKNNNCFFFYFLFSLFSFLFSLHNLEKMLLRKKITFKCCFTCQISYFVNSMDKSNAIVGRKFFLGLPETRKEEKFNINLIEIK